MNEGITWAELYVAFTLSTRARCHAVKAGRTNNDVINQTKRFSTVSYTLAKLWKKPVWPGQIGSLRTLRPFGCNEQKGFKRRPRLPNHAEVDNHIAATLAQKAENPNYNIKTRCWRWTCQFPVLTGGNNGGE